MIFPLWVERKQAVSVFGFKVFPSQLLAKRRLACSILIPFCCLIFKIFSGEEGKLGFAVQPKKTNRRRLYEKVIFTDVVGCICVGDGGNAGPGVHHQ
jgi:hypothetical protein